MPRIHESLFLGMHTIVSMHGNINDIVHKRKIYLGFFDKLKSSSYAWRFFP